MLYYFNTLVRNPTSANNTFFDLDRVKWPTFEAAQCLDVDNRYVKGNKARLTKILNLLKKDSRMAAAKSVSPEIVESGSKNKNYQTSAGNDNVKNLKYQKNEKSVGKGNDEADDSKDKDNQSSMSNDNKRNNQRSTGKQYDNADDLIENQISQSTRKHNFDQRNFKDNTDQKSIANQNSKDESKQRSTGNEDDELSRSKNRKMENSTGKQNYTEGDSIEH